MNCEFKKQFSLKRVIALLCSLEKKEKCYYYFLNEQNIDLIVNDEIRRFTKDSIKRYQTDIFFVDSHQSMYIIIPKLPQRFDIAGKKEFEIVMDFIKNNPLIAIVLIQLGRLAVGISKGIKKIDSKIATRFVKNRHKAGGQSQRRFERNRLKQIQEFKIKACTITTEKLTKFEGKLDKLFVGGEKLVLNAFLNECLIFQRFNSKIINRVVNFKRADERNLLKLMKELTSYEVVKFNVNFD